MTEAENADLCMSLMRADTDEEVQALLAAAGYWNNPTVWRYLGDIENNYSTVGNQQAEPIAAMAEKLVNGIDARLINACAALGIKPSSAEAPNSITDAVASFFGGGTERSGHIVNWDRDMTRNESLQLTLVATGETPPGYPSISIADGGEGQTPDSQPTTFMSISGSNKLRIPFVQGKYNMGGTGALNFCSTPNRLQLVVSRRNPDLLQVKASERDRQWGFTIVRREPPVGNQKHPFFTYLAPVGASDRDGGVLAFRADEWPIFPETTASTPDPYSRMSRHGSLVKLYQYRWKGSRSNIVSSRDGLLRRLDQALPELALPIRLYECRPGYRGHAGSFATNLTGLSVRLEQDRGKSLDDSIENPRRSTIDVGGQLIRVRVFVFRTKEQALEYRTRKNAMLMVVNGQTHAAFSQDLFMRKSVRLGYLADSLLVVLDCSELSGVTRDELFMNSRDRVRETDISDGILEEVEDLLRDDPGLRELQNRRRKEDIEDRLADNQPLADAFQDILRSDPTLERLFLTGQAISAPFARQGAGEGTGGRFEGKPYPSYWRFKNKQQHEELDRPARLGSVPRVEFETDVDNTYFDRGENPDLIQGEWHVYRTDRGVAETLMGCRLDGPRDGIAVLHINLPPDLTVGTVLTLEVEVGDDTMPGPFTNKLQLTMSPPGSGGGGNGRSSSVNRGQGDRGGTSNLALPEIIRVTEGEWGLHDFHTFTEDDALWLVRTQGDDDRDQLDFYINVDNKYLKTVQKNGGRGADPNLVERQFMYANVLIGMAMLNAEAVEARSGDEATTEEESEEVTENTEERINRVTRALAPIILPMVDVLASLSLEEAAL
jgi:hypothetical protein